jgi:large subunit ribosomal protein L10
LAITKERKDEIVAQYSEWIKRSQATVITEYNGLTMKELDDLRKKTRDIGGEFHVVKNTLGKLAFEKAGMPIPKDLFDGSTAVCFAFTDAPAMAKAVMEYAKSSEKFKIKGGYLDNKPMTAEGVKSLSELPPLPVMRAQLMGTLLAPASQLARLLAEPGRRIAAVIKAYAEPEPETAAANA